jgi:hypothetical protein
MSSRPPDAVLELDELRNAVAARLLPKLGRRDDGHEHLLSADHVHLFADDLDDLLVHAPAERQEGPQAGSHLPDKAPAHQQAVAGGLGIPRVLPERRDEEL